MRVAHPYLAGPALVSSRRAPAFHPLHRPAEHGENVRDHRLAEVALSRPLTVAWSVVVTFLIYLMVLLRFYLATVIERSTPQCPLPFAERLKATRVKT